MLVYTPNFLVTVFQVLLWCVLPKPCLSTTLVSRLERSLTFQPIRNKTESIVTCFPALSTGFTYSRAWHQWRVSSHFSRLTCFPAHRKVSYLISATFCITFLKKPLYSICRVFGYKIMIIDSLSEIFDENGWVSLA